MSDLKLRPMEDVLLHPEHKVELAALLARVAALEAERDEAVAKAEALNDCRRGPGWTGSEPPCGACSTCLTRSIAALERVAEAAAIPCRCCGVQEHEMGDCPIRAARALLAPEEPASGPGEG